MSAAQMGVLLTERTLLFHAAVGLNTTATTPNPRLTSISKLQQLSMESTAHLAATTKSRQMLKSSCSMHGCMTWIAKGGGRIH